MEAIAEYPYQAASDTELSFDVGDRIVIVPYDDTWCRGRINGVEGFVPKTYIKELPHPWFKGNISRDKSEEFLLKKDRYSGNFVHQDGAFLIRNSENSPGDFSASVKYNGSVQHFKIFSKDNKYLIWTTPFESFNELVEFHRTNSISRSHNILLKDMADDSNTNGADNNQKSSLYYEAMYPFNAQDESELSFAKGDLLKIIDTSDQNWWTAEKNGQTGYVPATYIRPYK